MKILSIIVLLSVVACGTNEVTVPEVPDCNFVTRSVCVKTTIEYVDSEFIDTALTVAFDSWYQVTGEDLSGSFNGRALTVDFRTLDGYQGVRGTAYEHLVYVTVGTINGAQIKTSGVQLLFVHELFHVLSDISLGTLDEEHANDIVWTDIYNAAANILTPSGKSKATKI